MHTDRELLIETYANFNARAMDAVLDTMHPDVDWPNGMEGGRVHGRSSVRDYWTRQWGLIDPHVEPVSFKTDETGRTIVTVHQVVHDLEGKLLLDQMVEHVYRIEDGLIRSMEIQESEQK
jgi:SnoaL-like domain